MPSLPLLEADASIEGGEGLPLDLSRSLTGSIGRSRRGAFRLDRAAKLPESLVLELEGGRRVGLLGTCVCCVWW